uniref:Leucine rich repeat containing 56 n=1 Tax=Leptobrachium leishanense TaxID=445787 RepID=A0A8C5N595_9ANUR
MSQMDKTLDMRPGTASVRVTDFGWQGPLNPSPLNQDNEDDLVDDYLSPAKLKALTGEEDLTGVRTLQICLNTREHSLGNFGSYMPKLRQLKLNNSVILSVRDLGTSLSHLEVLWMVRCGLSDLDGIASLYSLKELYLAFNDLRDLSQLSMLENLEILDLEGNNLDHLRELQYLALCTSLTTLILEGNPVCTQPNPEVPETQDYNYRIAVRNIIPQLQILDEVPIHQLNTDTPTTDSYDWEMVRDGIKNHFANQTDAGLVADPSMGKLRPKTAQPAILRRPFTAPRPTSAGRPVTSHQRPGGNSFGEPIEDGTAEDEASDLTHGVGRVICGNPIKALRARKEKLVNAPIISAPQLGTKSEQVNNTEMATDSNCGDVLAELKAWREKHHIQLQKIQEERAPQVLKIKYSDEDEESTGSEHEDDAEELNDSWDMSYLVRVTPDCSSPSPLTSKSPTGAQHPGEMNLSEAKYTPSPPVTPSPPASGIGIQRSTRGADIRMRRMLRGVSRSGAISPRLTMYGDEAVPLVEIDRNNYRIPSPPKPMEERSNGLSSTNVSRHEQKAMSNSRYTFHL